MDNVLISVDELEELNSLVNYIPLAKHNRYGKLMEKFIMTAITCGEAGVTKLDDYLKVAK